MSGRCVIDAYLHLYSVKSEGGFSASEESRGKMEEGKLGGDEQRARASLRAICLRLRGLGRGAVQRLVTASV